MPLCCRKSIFYIKKSRLRNNDMINVNRQWGEIWVIYERNFSLYFDNFFFGYIYFHIINIFVRKAE